MPCPPQMTVCMCVYGVGCVCVVRDMETDTQGMEKWRHGQKNVEGGWQLKPGDDRRLEG